MVGQAGLGQGQLEVEAVQVAHLVSERQSQQQARQVLHAVYHHPVILQY